MDENDIKKYIAEAINQAVEKTPSVSKAEIQEMFKEQAAAQVATEVSYEPKKDTQRSRKEKLNEIWQAQRSAYPDFSSDKHVEYFLDNNAQLVNEFLKGGSV